MAYYSGSAVDMAGVRTALLTACQAEGWTLSGSVLHKDSVFVEITLNFGSLALLGGTSVTAGVLGGAAPRKSHIAVISPMAVTWPAGYECFIFDYEVYLVVRYSVDRYQWCCFGKSTVSLPGTGCFVAASFSDYVPDAIWIESYSGNTALPAPLPFWYGYMGSQVDISRVHHGLSGETWTAGDYYGASQCLTELLGVLPNAWNSESVLLPIRAYLARPSSKCSLVIDLAHARYLRIDNHEPGEIIQLGSDMWKVFPAHRKNSAARDGGVSILHTGTFGWAIRYEGP